MRPISVNSCRRVTAIGARSSGDEFLTGGLKGEVDLWSWDGDWKQKRLQRATRCKRRQLSDSAWATYKPASIVGLCSLYDGNRWVSVTAGGELRLWDGENLVRTWEIPELGSPRAIAAHPGKPEIAIGVKKEGEPRPEAVVLLVEVET